MSHKNVAVDADSIENTVYILSNFGNIVGIGNIIAEGGGARNEHYKIIILPMDPVSILPFLLSDGTLPIEITLKVGFEYNLYGEPQLRGGIWGNTHMHTTIMDKSVYHTITNKVQIKE